METFGHMETLVLVVSQLLVLLPSADFCAQGERVVCHDVQEFRKAIQRPGFSVGYASNMPFENPTVPPEIYFLGKFQSECSTTSIHLAHALRIDLCNVFSYVIGSPLVGRNRGLAKVLTTVYNVLHLRLVDTNKFISKVKKLVTEDSNEGLDSFFSCLEDILPPELSVTSKKFSAYFRNSNLRSIFRSGFELLSPYYCEQQSALRKNERSEIMLARLTSVVGNMKSALYALLTTLPLSSKYSSAPFILNKLARDIVDLPESVWIKFVDKFTSLSRKSDYRMVRSFLETFELSSDVPENIRSDIRQVIYHLPEEKSKIIVGELQQMPNLPTRIIELLPINASYVAPDEINEDQWDLYSQICKSHKAGNEETPISTSVSTTKLAQHSKIKMKDESIDDDHKDIKWMSGTLENVDSLGKDMYKSSTNQFSNLPINTTTEQSISGKLKLNNVLMKKRESTTITPSTKIYEISIKTTTPTPPTPKIKYILHVIPETDSRENKTHLRFKNGSILNLSDKGRMIETNEQEEIIENSTGMKNMILEEDPLSKEQITKPPIETETSNPFNVDEIQKPTALENTLNVMTLKETEQPTTREIRNILNLSMLMETENSSTKETVTETVTETVLHERIFDTSLTEIGMPFTIADQNANSLEMPRRHEEDEDIISESVPAEEIMLEMNSLVTYTESEIVTPSILTEGYHTVSAQVIPTSTPSDTIIPISQTKFIPQVIATSAPSNSIDPVFQTEFSPEVISTTIPQSTKVPVFQAEITTLKHVTLPKTIENSNDNFAETPTTRLEIPELNATSLSSNTNPCLFPFLKNLFSEEDLIFLNEFMQMYVKTKCPTTAEETYDTLLQIVKEESSGNKGRNYEKEAQTSSKPLTDQRSTNPSNLFNHSQHKNLSLNEKVKALPLFRFLDNLKHTSGNNETLPSKNEEIANELSTERQKKGNEVVNSQNPKTTPSYVHKELTTERDSEIESDEVYESDITDPSTNINTEQQHISDFETYDTTISNMKNKNENAKEIDQTIEDESEEDDENFTTVEKYVETKTQSNVDDVEHVIVEGDKEDSGSKSSSEETRREMYITVTKGDETDQNEEISSQTPLPYIKEEQINKIYSNVNKTDLTVEEEPEEYSSETTPLSFPIENIFSTGRKDESHEESEQIFSTEVSSSLPKEHALDIQSGQSEESEDHENDDEDKVETIFEILVQENHHVTKEENYSSKPLPLTEKETTDETPSSKQFRNDDVNEETDSSKPLQLTDKETTDETPSSKHFRNDDVNEETDSSKPLPLTDKETTDETPSSKHFRNDDVNEETDSLMSSRDADKEKDNTMESNDNKIGTTEEEEIEKNSERALSTRSEGLNEMDSTDTKAEHTVEEEIDHFSTESPTSSTKEHIAELVSVARQEKHFEKYIDEDNLEVKSSTVSEKVNEEDENNLTTEDVNESLGKIHLSSANSEHFTNNNSNVSEPGTTYRHVNRQKFRSLTSQELDTESENKSEIEVETKEEENEEHLDQLHSSFSNSKNLNTKQSYESKTEETLKEETEEKIIPTTTKSVNVERAKNIYSDESEDFRIDEEEGKEWKISKASQFKNKERVNEMPTDGSENVGSYEEENDSDSKDEEDENDGNVSKNSSPFQNKEKPGINERSKSETDSSGETKMKTNLGTTTTAASNKRRNTMLAILKNINIGEFEKGFDGTSKSSSTDDEAWKHYKINQDKHYRAGSSGIDIDKYEKDKKLGKKKFHEKFEEGKIDHGGDDDMSDENNIKVTNLAANNKQQSLIRQTDETLGTFYLIFNNLPSLIGQDRKKITSKNATVSELRRFLRVSPNFNIATINNIFLTDPLDGVQEDYEEE